MKQIKFIADIGSNHNQDIDRAYDLIGAAKIAGCWGVKFQAFKANTLYAPGFIPEGLQDNELNLEWIQSLADVCDTLGIKFGVTFFDLEIAKEYIKYCDFVKISSFDILRHDLIKYCNEHCVEYEKPLIISTGEADFEEIDAVMEICKIRPFNFALLHCISEYPVKNLTDLGLRTIHMLRDRYNILTGWSDHTVKSIVILKIISQFSVDIIECHFDLDDMKGAESHYGHVWSYTKLKEVIGLINYIKETDVSGIYVHNEDKRLARADPKDGLRPRIEKRLKRSSEDE